MRDEIRPPAWAVGNARRLTSAEFVAEFGRWSPRVRSRTLKCETWQSYLEPETASLREYAAGNYGAVESLLEAEAELDGQVYDRVRANGTPFVRARAVLRPLTPYLTFEMWNYVVRAALGETIEIADLTAAGRRLPNHDVFDFLLFDDEAALIHDYGRGREGLQNGGWLTTDTDVLARLDRLGAHLRRRAVPLEQFLRTHGIRIPSSAPSA
jgi:hypothetical protein